MKNIHDINRYIIQYTCDCFCILDCKRGPLKPPGPTLVLGVSSSDHSQGLEAGLSQSLSVVDFPEQLVILPSHVVGW